MPLEEISERDLEFYFVERYFSLHPNETKCSRKQINSYNGKPLSYSYLKQEDGTFFAMASDHYKVKELGSGAFGRVKAAEENTAVKIQSIDSEEKLEKSRVEAAINLDLGIATGALIEREIGSDFDKSWKVYQRMANLGQPLSKILQTERQALANEADHETAKHLLKLKEIDRAIELCLLVDDLHSGASSKKKIGYAHRDIKPANILVDEHGRLRLIDFGAATSEVSAMANWHEFHGTPSYAPIDIKHVPAAGDHVISGLWRGFRALFDQRDSQGNPPVLTNTTYDIIALLRTLSHPLDPNDKKQLAVLSQSTRASLPTSILNLLDTSLILPHLDGVRSHETAKFFAAVLILYKQKGDQITQEDIDILRDNVELINQLTNVERATSQHSPAESVHAQDLVLIESELAELEKVQRHFESNPDKTKYSRKESGFSNSYFKSIDGPLFSVANKSDERHVRGKGTYGRVKGASSDTVVKIQWIHSVKELQEARKEAEINLEMGIATSALIERSFINEHNQLIWKVYQPMHDFGQRLSDTIAHQPAPTTEASIRHREHDDIHRAIQLCILVDECHTGTLSNRRIAYAHKDIKPDNILVNREGNLRLVDFGSSTTQLTDPAFGREVKGTPGYLPIDAAVISGKTGDALRAAMTSHIQQMDRTTVTNAIQDKISTLRTLTIPPCLRAQQQHAIISDTTFARFPKHVQDLLNTETISQHLTPERQSETMKFFAAVLIVYRNNGYHISEEEVQHLRQVPALQDAAMKTEQTRQTSSMSDFHSVDKAEQSSSSEYGDICHPSDVESMSNSTNSMRRKLRDIVDEKSESLGSNPPSTKI